MHVSGVKNMTDVNWHVICRNWHTCKLKTTQFCQNVKWHKHKTAFNATCCVPLGMRSMNIGIWATGCWVLGKTIVFRGNTKFFGQMPAAKNLFIKWKKRNSFLPLRWSARNTELFGSVSWGKQFWIKLCYLKCKHFQLVDSMLFGQDILAVFLGRCRNIFRVKTAQPS